MAINPESGYPRQPLAYRLADVFVQWARRGQCPIEDMEMEGITQLTTVTDLQQWTHVGTYTDIYIYIHTIHLFLTSLSTPQPVYASQ